MAVRLLYVEDDEDAARLVRDVLVADGIEVHAAGTGEQALAVFDELAPELVLIDLHLPGTDGLAVCRTLRARSAVPIVIATASSDAELPIRALDDGADDFLRKPFDVRELAARIRALLRRARGDVVELRQRLEVGVVAIDFASRSVRVRGEPVAVTSTELALLGALAQHAGAPMSREQLVRIVHGTDDAAFERSIDVLVSRLRTKLERDVRRPTLIRTVRGIGYVLAITRE